MALARFCLCLLIVSWTRSSTSRAAKITNFTIGAVLNDDRHDTLFREAITVRVAVVIITSRNFKKLSIAISCIPTIIGIYIKFNYIFFDITRN